MNDGYVKLNQDSITVNMVVKIKTDKYFIVEGMTEDNGETSIALIQLMIDNQDFTAEYIPTSFTNTSTGTLIITQKDEL